MKIGVCLCLLCFTYQVGFTQTTPYLKEQIVQYLEILHNQPIQIEMVENRLLFELKDSVGYSLLEGLTRTKIQENPDEKVYDELLSWEYLQQKNFEKSFIQEVALDKREKGNGLRLMNLGRICLRNKSYEIATQSFNYVLSKEKTGVLYRSAKRAILSGKEHQILERAYQNKDFLSLYYSYQDFISEFKEGEDVAEAKLSLAKLEIEYLNKIDLARVHLKELLRLKDDGANSNLFKANCKMVLAHADLLKGLVWESALLYNQVHIDYKDEPLGQEALLESARLYYFAGDFRLAKSQLDVLKTATSELTANDALDLSLLIQKNLEEDSLGLALKLFAKAGLFIYQHKSDEAEKLLDSIPLKYPKYTDNSLADDILMAKYQIFVYEHRFEKASEVLMKVYSLYPKGIWADNALYLCASLYEQSLKNLPKAQELYEKVFLMYPGSFYARQARERYRILRGDKTPEL